MTKATVLEVRSRVLAGVEDHSGPMDTSRSVKIPCTLRDIAIRCIHVIVAANDANELKRERDRFYRFRVILTTRRWSTCMEENPTETFLTRIATNKEEKGKLWV